MLLQNHRIDCNKCELVKIQQLVEIPQKILDDLILRSNVHKCRISILADEKNKGKNEEVASTSMEIVKHDSQTNI